MKPKLPLLYATMFALWFAHWPRVASAQDDLERIYFPDDSGSEALSLGMRSLLQVDSFLGFVDGNVTSYPPEQTLFDRTVILQFEGQAQFAIGSTGVLGITVATQYRKTQISSAFEPKLSSQSLRALPRADFYFRHAAYSGTELTVGLELFDFPSYEFVTRAADVKTTQHASHGRLIRPYFAAVKRGATFAGVLFIKDEHETTRRIRKKSDTDGSTLESEEILHKPTEVGLQLQMSSASATYGLGFAAIHSGSGGPKRTNGSPQRDDHLRFHLLAQLPSPVTAETDWRLKLCYQTLAYATNQDVNLATIPNTTLWLQSMPKATGWGWGIFVAVARDEQSVPEFNARYETTGAGGQLTAQF